MSLCAESEALLKLRAGSIPLRDMSPSQARNSGPKPLPSLEVVHEIREIDADGVPCRFYRPARDKEDCSPSDPSHTLGLLLYFHGGGFVMGSLDKADNVCRMLANQSGHCVLSVDYRLAPEHPFPVPLQDCVAAARWAHTQAEGELGCDSGRMCVAGDSAGGNLATLVAQTACIPFLCQVLIYPVCDMRCLYDSGAHDRLVRGSGSSYERFGGGDFGMSYADMKWCFDHYVSSSSSSSGGGGSGDPLERISAQLNPCLAPADVLRALPPTLVLTAECDVLRDEGEAYSAQLRSQGVLSRCVRFPGHMHGFFTCTTSLAAAREAVWLVAGALRRAMHRGSKHVESLFAASPSGSGSSSSSSSSRRSKSKSSSKSRAEAEAEVVTPTRRQQQQQQQLVPTGKVVAARPARPARPAPSPSPSQPPHYARPPSRGRLMHRIGRERERGREKDSALPLPLPLPVSPLRGAGAGAEEGADLDVVQFMIARGALVCPAAAEEAGSNTGRSGDSGAQVTEPAATTTTTAAAAAAASTSLYAEELRAAAVVHKVVRRQLARRFARRYARWLRGLRGTRRVFASDPAPAPAPTSASASASVAAPSPASSLRSLRPRVCSAEEAALFAAPRWYRDRVAEEREQEREQAAVLAPVPVPAPAPAPTPLETCSTVCSRRANGAAAADRAAERAAQLEAQREAGRVREAAYSLWLQRAAAKHCTGDYLISARVRGDGDGDGGARRTAHAQAERGRERDGAAGGGLPLLQQQQQQRRQLAGLVKQARSQLPRKAAVPQLR